MPSPVCPYCGSGCWVEVVEEGVKLEKGEQSRKCLVCETQYRVKEFND
jgi:hypothetical protein